MILHWLSAVIHPASPGFPYCAAFLPTLKSWQGRSTPKPPVPKRSDGIHWCVRIGNIDIPWGIGDNGRGYAANGTITVSRLSVDSTNFNKKGLPYTRVGDVYYLYESEFTGNGFVGFAPYLRDRLLPHIINVADSSPATSFQGELDTKLRENPELKMLLDSHNLTLEKVRVDRITNKKNQS